MILTGTVTFQMNKSKSSCETCANYIFDEQTQNYYCEMNLDEDEMARFLTYSTYNCPYYDYYDEYSIVRKQN